MSKNILRSNPRFVKRIKAHPRTSGGLRPIKELVLEVMLQAADAMLARDKQRLAQALEISR